MNSLLFTEESILHPNEIPAIEVASRKDIYTATGSYGFNYIDAPAGSGKTKWAISWAKGLNKYGLNVLIVVPTIKLADEYVKRSLGVFKVIHSSKQKTEDDDVRVIQKLKEVFKVQAHFATESKTFVITEKAMQMLHFLEKQPKWCVIVDEASEPLKIASVLCPSSKQLIKQWFKFEKCTRKKSGLYSIQRTQDCPKIENPKDAITGSLVDLVKFMDNNKLEVLVDLEKLKGDRAILEYSVFAKPDIYARFEQTYFMSANFCDTYLFHMYKDYGVNWVPKNLALSSADCSSRVDIHYCFEEASWSKTQREKAVLDTEDTHLQIYLQWVSSMNPHGDYIYTANESSKIDGALNGTKIPAVSHGLNEWREFTKVVICGSYLVNNTHSRFYEHYGCSTSDARGLRNTQMIYQQIMRTNLRVPESNQRITVIVPTLTEARELLAYLPMATIHNCWKSTYGQLTNVTAKLKTSWAIKPSQTIVHEIENHNKIVMSDALFYKNQKTCNIDLSDGEIDWYYEEQVKSSHDSSTCKRKRGTNKRVGSTILQTIAELNSDIDLSGVNTEDGLNWFKKNMLRMFLTGLYPDGVSFEKENCYGNSRIIAFDLDGTDLTDKQISNAFRGSELLIYTTVKNKLALDGLRRLRVVVLCNRNMTLNEHEIIMTHYKKVLMSLTDKHGIDTSKDDPWGKFVMPDRSAYIAHIKYEKKPLEVEKILRKYVSKAINKVTAPTSSDLEFDNPMGFAPNITSTPKVDALISQMQPKNRSEIAVSVAGKLQNKPHAVKQEKLNEMIAKGIDSSAQKSARKYMGLL